MSTSVYFQEKTIQVEVGQKSIQTTAQPLETVVEFSMSLRDNIGIYSLWMVNLGLPNISTHWKQASHYSGEKSPLFICELRAP